MLIKIVIARQEKKELVPKRRMKTLLNIQTEHEFEQALLDGDCVAYKHPSENITLYGFPTIVHTKGKDPA